MPVDQRRQQEAALQVGLALRARRLSGRGHARHAALGQHHVEQLSIGAGAGIAQDDQDAAQLITAVAGARRTARQVRSAHRSSGNCVAQRAQPPAGQPPQRALQPAPFSPRGGATTIWRDE